MELKVSDYVSSHRHKALHEINKAEDSKLTVVVVLNTDTGEFYWQAAGLIDSIPAKDCIIHRCDSFPRKREMSYLNEIVDKISQSGKMLETGIIYQNAKKAEIINVYETMTNSENRITRRSLNPIYSAIHFEPMVRQAEIDEKYAIAVRHITSIRPEDEYAEVEREFGGFLRLNEFETTGKKVLDAMDDQDYCLCPNCGYELASAEWEMFMEHFDKNYCQKCGQKLIWKD